MDDWTATWFNVQCRWRKNKAARERADLYPPQLAALGLTSTAPRPGGVLTKPLAPFVAATRLELNSMPAFETEAQRTARLQACIN